MQPLGDGAQCPRVFRQPDGAAPSLDGGGELRKRLDQGASPARHEGQGRVIQVRYRVADRYHRAQAIRVGGTPGETTHQPGELLYQGSSVNRGAAVEDRHDLVIATYLLECA